MYTLQFPIPSTIQSTKIDSIMDSIINHPDLYDCDFEVKQVKDQFHIIAHDFPIINKVHTLITTYKPVKPVVKKETKDDDKEFKRVSSTRPNKSKPSTTNDVVVKKPIHPDIVANNLIARTIGKQGCFMRSIQEQFGVDKVQRISVGDKPGNYNYTLYTVSQQVADEVYIALQKHEFQVIKECIVPKKSTQQEQLYDNTDSSDTDDDIPIDTKPDKVYPPGTSWADMMEDDD